MITKENKEKIGKEKKKLLADGFINGLIWLKRVLVFCVVFFSKKIVLKFWVFMRCVLVPDHTFNNICL